MTAPRAIDVTSAPPVAFVQIKFNREVEILFQLIVDEVDIGTENNLNCISLCVHA